MYKDVEIVKMFGVYYICHQGEVVAVMYAKLLEGLWYIMLLNPKCRGCTLIHALKSYRQAMPSYEEL